MKDKTDWTTPLTIDDDLCCECEDTSACPDEDETQSIEVGGYSICLTCSNYTSEEDN